MLMPTPIHIAVMAGARQKVVTTVAQALRPRGILLVAPVPEQNGDGVSERYKRTLIDHTAATVREWQAKSRVVTLSFWHYDFGEGADQNRDLRRLFFPFACQVGIPRTYYNHPIHTANFIIDSVENIEKFLAAITKEVTSRRNTSPVVLPIENFRSKILPRFADDIYFRAFIVDIETWLKSRKKYFREQHSRRPSSGSNKPCFHDDRHYAFQPNQEANGHGRKWPSSDQRCYLKGWLRFGATLVGGFHYDVQPTRGNVAGNFFHCDGRVEDFTGKGFTYVNIYPNDHIIPKKR